MNEMIERYIYDVTRRLPENERDEVRQELKASIVDMLPDDPDDPDDPAIRDVLSRLGAPRLLAEQYRQKPRYLISPAMFDLYISVLKMVVPIVAGISACIGFFDPVLSVSIGKLAVSVLSLAIEGAVQGLFWVTFGFVLFEHFDVKKDGWTVDNLPKLPDQSGVKISRASTVVDMIMSIFFTCLIISMIISGQWIFILNRGAEIIPPFSVEAGVRMIPFIVAAGIFSVILSCLKLIWARWNIPLCVINFVYNIAWTGAAIYILHWPDLLSREMTDFVATLITEVDAVRYVTADLFSSLIAVVAMVDIGTSIWNTSRGLRR